jgi:hypothetical protein
VPTVRQQDAPAEASAGDPCRSNADTLAQQDMSLLPLCDLLIAHQDDGEHLLASIFTEQKLEVVGNDYLVNGTMARPAWKRGTQQQLNPQGMFEALHDFKEVVTFKLEWG